MRHGLPFWFRQLIGYALLDWNDAFALQRVGFYFSRQGEWMSWGLPNLIRQSTAVPEATLQGLREEFHTLAHEHNP